MSDNAQAAADEAWEQLLRQLRNRPVPPRPFSYARLRARLAAETAPRPALPWWLRRPAYAALLGLLTVALHADSVLARPSGGRPGRRSEQAPLPKPQQAELPSQPFPSLT